MAVTLNISADFADVMDNTEAVTVVLMRSSGRQEVEIDTAHQTQPDRNQINASGIQLNEGQAVTWGVPNEELNPASNGRVIKVDDQIVSASQPSVIWAVKSSKLIGMGGSRSYWQCVCQEIRG